MVKRDGSRQDRTGVSGGPKAYLFPTIAVITSAGKEVVLADDRIGPVSETVVIDFAVIDDGERDIQLVTIARDPSRSTFRSCLQEHCMFHAEVTSPTLSLGYCKAVDPTSRAEAGEALSAIVAPRPSSVLESFVVSTTQAEDAYADPRSKIDPLAPYVALQESAGLGPPGGQVIFQGADIAEAARWTSRAGHVQHWTPQSVASAVQKAQARSSIGSRLDTHPDIRRYRLLLGSPRYAEPGSQADFWHHIRYSDDPDLDQSSKMHLSSQGADRVENEGEFWLTKSDVEKEGAYFAVSMTAAQALLSCVVFRFSCPQTFLSLIEASACAVLRHSPIPSAGLLVTVEEDPGDEHLLRLVCEHRGNIVDDLVLCECSKEARRQAIVCLEIYDAGSAVHVQASVSHNEPGKTLRTVCGALVIDASIFDEAIWWDGSLTARANLETPVSDGYRKFPVKTVHPGMQDLGPYNRIFIHTSRAYEEDAVLKIPVSEYELDTNTDTNSVGSFKSVDQDRDDAMTARSDTVEADPPTLTNGTKGHAGAAVAATSMAKVPWLRPCVDSIAVCKLVDNPFKKK
jgi:hypothetical protein